MDLRVRKRERERERAHLRLGITVGFEVCLGDASFEYTSC